MGSDRGQSDVEDKREREPKRESSVRVCTLSRGTHFERLGTYLT